MENIFIYRQLKQEFEKFADENNQASEVKGQRASWEFGVYPSTSQIYEIHMCHRETDTFTGLHFYEFCLLVAAIRSAIFERHTDDEKNGFVRRPTIGDQKGRKKQHWDVFLGGACNPTTWRFDVAIPFLKEKNITFFNPQVSEWHSNLVDIEECAKETARVLFFVLDIRRTRGIASLVEAAFLSGQGRNLVLVLPAEVPRSAQEVEVKELEEGEFQSIHRSYMFIADLVQRQGIPIFTSVKDALRATRASLISGKMVQDLTEVDGVASVRHSFVNVSNTVTNLEAIFTDLDTESRGSINRDDVKLGLNKAFGTSAISSIISTDKHSFEFADFCIEYSVLLLNSILSVRRMGPTGISSAAITSSGDHKDLQSSYRCSSVFAIRSSVPSSGLSNDAGNSMGDLSARPSRLGLTVVHSAAANIEKMPHDFTAVPDPITNSSNGKSRRMLSKKNVVAVQPISSKDASKLQPLTLHSPVNTAFCICCEGQSKLPRLMRRLGFIPCYKAVVASSPESSPEVQEGALGSTELSLASQARLNADPPPHYDIFLGGTCGDSSWREHLAIPFLDKWGCSYYNPKIINKPWSRRLLPDEAEARTRSKVLVYVITNECTSTAALVEAAHFIGQGRSVVLHVQYLMSVAAPGPSPGSPPLSPMAKFLQSSCSFPLSAPFLPELSCPPVLDTAPANSHSASSGFFSLSPSTPAAATIDTAAATAESNDGATQYPRPRLSCKLSASDAGRLSLAPVSMSSRPVTEFALAVSMNNISKINPLPLSASKDHDRGRRYLLEIASRASVPVFLTIQETVAHAVTLVQQQQVD